MRFELKELKLGIPVLIRKIGYVPWGSRESEFSCIKRLAVGDYPRFHLYIKEKGSVILFNLHLDQKKPSYQGSSAHSGEYEGDIIEKEKERILNLIT